MSSILDAIKETLEDLAADEEYPLSGGVYYGACRAKTLPEWNYFVFNRIRVVPTNHSSYTDYYQVHIVHEDYVMEGYELQVVKALKEAIGGLSLAENLTFDYMPKQDTQMIVEICTLTFKHAKKVEDG